MSTFALLMAILLLAMHACSARHIFTFVPYDKDIEKAKLHEMEVQGLPIFNPKEILLRGKATSMATLHESQRALKMQNLKGNARFMLEAASQVATKSSQDAAKDGDQPFEDPTVMDYAQAHHETPIHNQH
uniref:Uncharacterized protein n=1 Tax=Opuntia streptacantha TaxID=393608 RepID=A0A7C9F234_OPUST